MVPSVYNPRLQTLLSYFHIHTEMAISSKQLDRKERKCQWHCINVMVLQWGEKNVGCHIAGTFIFSIFSKIENSKKLGLRIDENIIYMANLSDEKQKLCWELWTLGCSFVDWEGHPSAKSKLFPPLQCLVCVRYCSKSFI